MKPLADLSLRPREARLILSVAALLISAGLSLWNLDRAPPGLHNDEAYLLLNAQEIVSGEAFPVFLTGNNGIEPLFAYLASLSLLSLGPVIWAGRLTAAFAGIIAVAATIRVGNELFPRRETGAVAGVLLATLYTHLHFSRYGIQYVLASLAGAGAMAALWHGARTTRWQAYALAGVVTGLGLTTNQSFRLFPFALPAIGVALLIARWDERRQLFPRGLLAGGIALIVFAPLGLFFLQHPAWFLNRFGQTTAATLGAADSLKIVWVNALKVAGGLFWRGDASRLYNLPLRPVLDPIQALFFAVGLVACLRRPRQPETWALLAWAAVGLLPSILTEDAPRFGRITMATPALVLIAAQGVLALWHATIARRIPRGLIVAALVFSTGVTIRDYFVTWAEDPRTYSAFNGEELALALALRDAPPGAALYAAPLQRDYYQNYETGQRFGPADGFNSYDRGYWSMEYLLGPEAFSRTSMFNARECLVLPAVTTASTRYAVISEQTPQTLPALEAAFPAGERGVSAAVGGQSKVETFQSSQAKPPE